MFARSPYPLLSLKILGILCPCLETDDDCLARRAAWALHAVPIRWHRPLYPSSSAESNNTISGTSVAGFISGLFAGSSVSESVLSESALHYDVIEKSLLSVVDSIRGPLLVISPSLSDASIEDFNVPLQILKSIQIHNENANEFKDVSMSGIRIFDTSGSELLRFNLLKPITGLLQEGERSVEDADEKSRDELIDHLEALIKWERQRQDLLGGSDDLRDKSNDSSDVRGAASSKTSGGVLAEQARKIQHFAQRELEMQKIKRERETRKAKYIKEAGGLKYTAIAMANRT